MNRPIIAFITLKLMVASATADLSNSLNSFGNFSTITNSQILELTALTEDASISNIQWTINFDFKTIRVGDLQLSLGGEKKRTIIISRGLDTYAFTPSDELYYSDPVVSDDGRAIFFLTHRYQALGKGKMIYRVDMEYHSLARLDIPDASRPLSGITRKFILHGKELRSLLRSRKAWVTSLDGISHDGTRLKLSIRSEDANNVPRDIEYFRRAYWYWLVEDRLSQTEVSRVQRISPGEE